MNRTMKNGGSARVTKKNFSNGSLRGHEAMHSLMLRMAADEARAQRIKQLKAGRPDLTWRRIADHVKVSERAALDWARTGGMEYENAKKLAELFNVEVDYLWRGPAPDPFQQEDGSQLDRIETKLDVLIERFTQGEPSAPEEIAAEIDKTADRQAQRRAERESEQAPTSTRKRRGAR